MTEMPSESRKPPRPLDPVPILHPVLFAIYPILGLYANNMTVTPFRGVIRPLLVLGLGAAALWVVLAVLLRKMHKAGVIASLLILACVSGWGILEYTIRLTLPYVGAVPTPCWYVVYGIVGIGSLGAIGIRWRKRPRAVLPWVAGLVGVLACIPVLAELVLFGALSRGAAWYVSVYLVAVAVLVTAALRHTGDFRKLTRTGNWFSIILVSLYLALILYNRTGSEAVPIPPLEQPIAEEERTYPDVYLIALEGYPRADELRRQFAYNNMLFLGDMRELGFTVASQSLANYSNQELALAACLNLDFVQDLVPTGEDPSVLLSSLYHGNRAFAFLRRHGYTLVACSPGLASLEPRSGIQACLRPPGVLSEFEMVFLEGTIGARVLQAGYAYAYDNPAYWRLEHRRKQIMYAFRKLPELAGAESDGPRFVLAHLLLPAPPFVFRRDGSRAKPYGAAAVGDETVFQGSDREFAASYLDQLHYTNTMLTESARQIIKVSRRPPVIIIVSSQGFGPAPTGANDDQPAGPGRLANLIMARFPPDVARPGGDPPVFDDSISLVNVLRVTLGNIFGADLPPLPDATYYSPPDRPFELQPAGI